MDQTETMPLRIYFFVHYLDIPIWMHDELLAHNSFVQVIHRIPDNVFDTKRSLRGNRNWMPQDQAPWADNHGRAPAIRTHHQGVQRGRVLAHRRDQRQRRVQLATRPDGPQWCSLRRPNLLTVIIEQVVYHVKFPPEAFLSTCTDVLSQIPNFRSELPNFRSELNKLSSERANIFS
jgi:hypothetical protein